ncbi:MAG: OmpA family protein, partial [Bacteroidota bacterium]
RRPSNQKCGSLGQRRCRIDDKGKELNPSVDAFGKDITGFAPGVKYTVQTDSSWNDQINLVAYDQEGEKFEEFISTQSEFTIEFLAQEEYDLAKEKDNDDSELFDLTADYGDTKINETLTFELTDSGGNPINVSLFNSQGKKVFGLDEASSVAGLNAKEVYTVKTDVVVKEEIKLVAFTKSGQRMKEFVANSSSFEIQFLDQEDYSLAQEENSDASLLFDLNGAVSSDEVEDYTKVSVVLKDGKGDQLNEVSTDEKGNFEFKNLSTEEEYYLSMLGIVGNAEIDVLGETGAPIDALDKSPGGNSFAYTRSRPEAAWMMTTSIELPMVFAIVPTAEVPDTETPDLYALGDSLVRRCRVDEDGFMELGSMVTGHAYELKFNKSTFNPTDRLVILDGYGDTTQTVRPDKDASFVFELMPPSAKVVAEEPVIADLEQSQTEKPKEDEEVAMTDENASEDPSEEVEPLMNLFGTSEGLSPSDPISVYDSDQKLLLETFVLDNGSFAINQIGIDSIFYIETSTAKSFKLTSAYHGFDRSGVKQPNGRWKFDFTEVEEMEKVVTLSNVYYRFDSYTLSPESKEALDALHSYLIQNPKQEIKVLSHTDSRGPRAYNEMLSNNRAREVVRYLIRRGIDESRLSYEGRGESQPVNECEDGVWCPNSKHAENRRTEFVLVKN